MGSKPGWNPMLLVHHNNSLSLVSHSLSCAVLRQECLDASTASALLLHIQINGAQTLRVHKFNTDISTIDNHAFQILFRLGKVHLFVFWT